MPEKFGLDVRYETGDGFRHWFADRIFSKSEYDPVDDPDGQRDNNTMLRRQLEKRQASLRIWRSVAILLGAALVVTLLLTPRPPRRYPQPEEGTDNVLRWMKEAESFPGHYWCGPTTDDAKARGCTFNKLHNRWMSPACAADFEPARTAVLDALEGDIPEFKFYRDVNGKPGAEISDTELENLPILTPQWTTVGHHMTHCMYLLLQAAAAMNLGTKADMVVHAWEHAKHCATVILNNTKRVPEWNDVASFGHSQSGVCW
ncbi:hypothetical protein CTRI78_v006760 [Colletotrichum trifolii]|uniref:Uncharacterized protein n=1 Tax=Colletotrichum trifolii TaxID=5466 RepID=A0A4R8RG20_COLTR|nr:hypothetical protein CTRI78_v006760 [Colletotrichum trifolii]